MQARWSRVTKHSAVVAVVVDDAFVVVAVVVFVELVDGVVVVHIWCPC